MVYSGTELEQAIHDSVNSYNWEPATGTSDRAVQQGLIFNVLSKPFRVKNYTLNLTSSGEQFEKPQPVGSSGSITVYAPPFGWVPTSFSVEKVTPPPPIQYFTYNYSSIYGTFSTSAESETIAYESFQQWLRQKEAQQPEPTPEPIPEPTPEPIEAPIITEPEPVYIPAIPIPQPTVDDSINTNMVTQQVINFNIIDGRAVGSIKFVATNNFNPFYYGKEIVNLVQFKTPNGVTLLVKENRLRFTETERDEIINYDEDMKGNTRATVESFVWEWIDKPAGAFSSK